MKRLLLIDGSNLMFRAYYATAYSGNLMQNSKGEYTNAVYALTNMLSKIAEESYTHILIAFDKGKATFRHKAYEEYKAQRKPMPEEFKSQLPHIKEVPKKLGMSVYETEELEADDIIGSLASKYYDDFDAIEIVSNDRDLYQLLNHKVTMRISKKGFNIDQTYTEETLYEDFKLKPSQIPDFKGLMGDASDNIPGIPGVGEKTALKLLHEFGDIESILKNLNELKGKLKERLEKHGKEALRWRELAEIKTDAELDLSLSDLEQKSPDQAALIEFLERMEFHSLIQRFETKKQDVPPLKIVRKSKSVGELLRGHVFLALETFGSNYHNAKKLGFAIISDAGHFFVPYETAVASKAMQDFLRDPSRKKSTFDYKKLLVCLKQDDLDVDGVVFDLLLAAYVLNPLNTKEDFRVVVSNFGYDDVPYEEDVYGKGAKRAVPEEKIYADYAIRKARAIETLEDTLNEELEKRDQQHLLQEVEMPLTKILAAMEHTGVRIDQEALKSFEKELEDELETLTAEIHDMAGEPFNIASPKQLGEVLFEKIGLPVQKRSKTGYSTSIDVLKKLQGKHPIIDKIMRHRTLNKLKTAYVQSLFESVHSDGKIHTIYKQAFTQTGRLSSIEPNLQTIPIRTETGRALRKVFIPDEDHVLLAADYSQIELRLLAHMAEEKQLIEAFEQGDDIHATTGKEILGKDDLAADERRLAKAVNFGIIYGQSAWGLSEELGVSRSEAGEFIKRYYERFPGIKAFMDGVIESAEEQGYVETLFKRRRYIPEIKSKIYAQRELGKRTAMNAPLQGSAADIIKIAMVETDKTLRKNNLKSTMILQIHDELVFNVRKDELSAMKDLVRKTMESAADLRVPLTVDVAYGGNLDEAK